MSSAEKKQDQGQISFRNNNLRLSTESEIWKFIFDLIFCIPFLIQNVINMSWQQGQFYLLMKTMRFDKKP